LPNGSGKQRLAQGIFNLLAIDPAHLTRVIDRRVYDATRTGEVYHDAKGARAAMEGWAYLFAISLPVGNRIVLYSFVIDPRSRLRMNGRFAPTPDFRYRRF
jgi:hypothetical protein